MKIGVNFHNTFPPTIAYLSRILNITDGKERSVEEISDLTGIPQGKSTGKVLPHLFYAIQMGLLNEDKATLSPLGKIVCREDPACQETLTQWLMHANLTSSAGADMWYFVVRELLPNNGGQISDAFYAEQMAVRYGSQTRYAVVASCYRKGLPALHYLDETVDGLRVNAQKFQREFLYLYAYDIVREWSCLYPDVREITAEQFSCLGSGDCFGFSQEEMFDVMERLAQKGVLRINRQLAPYTIILNTDISSMLPMLYSLLA